MPLCLLLLSITAHSQTYLYKRVAIIRDGGRKNVNDDAHYLTFNDKGCYESDADGYSQGNGIIKFRKNENNLHCYYGNGAYGPAHYYFSNDYRRLNVKTDEATYVYERETRGQTTAKRRDDTKNNSSGSVVVLPPVVGGGSNSSGTSSSSNSWRSEYGYEDCPHCYGTGDCSACNGKGLQYSVYTTYPVTCAVCDGRKSCKFCQGSGRRYKRIR